MKLKVEEEKKEMKKEMVMVILWVCSSNFTALLSNTSKKSSLESPISVTNFHIFQIYYNKLQT